ncbi:uncharacterized protein LOC134435676 isoform X2 [Engraulis encrasicolus]
MLQQERPNNATYGAPMSSTLRLLSNNSQQQQLNRKLEKDSNFNFLGENDSTNNYETTRLGGGGDENRNQVRPRSLGPMGREQSSTTTTISTQQHHVGMLTMGPLSPLSRLPCWRPLEPLEEVESGDDAGGRVPPDGAEEGLVDEEMRRLSDDGEKEEVEKELELYSLGSSSRDYGRELGEEEEEEDGLEWGDSDDEEFAFSSHSCSASSLADAGGESGGLGSLSSTWDRLCIGDQSGSVSIRSISIRGSVEGTEPGTEGRSESESEWDAGLEGGEGFGVGLGDGDGAGDEGDDVLEALWSAQDRQRFKEQEMQKHQMQLTMYRRLALIRWVRTLQARVQDQQNRLQDSFDVILTHRKELLRMGAATAVTTATASH